MAREKQRSRVAAPLRKLREDLGLTQLQVAERLGLTEGGYRSYESGRSSPSLEDLPVLSAALGLPVDEFLRRIGILEGEEIAATEEAPVVQLSEASVRAIAEQLREVVKDELVAAQHETELVPPPAVKKVAERRPLAEVYARERVRWWEGLSESKQRRIWEILEEPEVANQREEGAGQR